MGFVPQPVLPPEKKKSAAGRIVLVIFLAVVLLGFAGVIIASVTTPRSNSPEGFERAIEEIERDVAKLRELDWVHPVKKVIVSSDDLAERVRRTIEKEKAEASPTAGGQEQMLKFLHLIPQSMSLDKFAEDAYASDVLGYYDTDTKEIVVGGDTDKGISGYTKIILAHELVHALEDQHFDFEKIEKKLDAKNDGEAEAAFTSVAEGSATVAMIQYARSELSSAEMDQVQEETSKGDSEIEHAPAILREAMMFPYEAGADFISDIYVGGGWQAVDDLYSKLPSNTEQIMRPERYESGEMPIPTTVADATPTAVSGCELLDTGTIGARDMATMFGEIGHKKSTTRAADAWNGDAYRFDRCGNSEVFQAKVRGDDTAGTQAMLSAWEAYAKGWSDGEGKYAPKDAPRPAPGSTSVKAKDGYIAIVISNDPALAFGAMAVL